MYHRSFGRWALRDSISGTRGRGKWAGWSSCYSFMIRRMRLRFAIHPRSHNTERIQRYT